MDFSYFRLFIAISGLFVNFNSVIIMVRREGISGNFQFFVRFDSFPKWAYSGVFNPIQEGGQKHLRSTFNQIIVGRQQWMSTLIVCKFNLVY